MNDPLDNPSVLGKKVGLLGGTFDPVHCGHIEIASRVLEKFNLDSILFIPAATPPHKHDHAITPFAIRREMLEEAVKQYDDFYVTALEAEISGPSFTIDTLRRLRNKLRDDVFLMFIIGMDAFRDIATWKDYRELPDLADFAIINRPGYDFSALDAIICDLPGYFFDPQRGAWISAQSQGALYPVPVADMDISSTEIREKVRNRQSIGNEVPESVASLIVSHSLYH